MESRPFPTFEDALISVEKGESQYAMIPIENTTAGRVEEFYRLIPKMSLKVIGEHYQKINHCLIGNHDATVESIEKVYSHPQALAQCHDNIGEFNYKPIVNFDTAGSVKEIAESGSLTDGAIASSLSAELYSLKILKENFQDHDGNRTRFIILGREELNSSFNSGQKYITSIIFNLRNIPSALYKALGGFATNGINVVKIESYTPLGKVQVSQFHIDIEAHIEEKSFELALQELQFFGDEVKVIGCYPQDIFRGEI
jgi:prephenate dehydratase